MKDKRIVIVGGSSGIGKATADLAKSKGAEIILISRNLERLLETASKLEIEEFYTMDVNSEFSIEDTLSKIANVDYVFYSAGSAYLSSFRDKSIREQSLVLNSKINGLISVVHKLVPKINPGGAFVFTGGVSTSRPVLGAWVTNVYTSFAEQLSRALAVDLSPIRFNSVAPGWTDTPMWDSILGDSKEETLKSVADGLLVKQIAKPDEIANAVLFLFSNASVTGEVIHVDGGGRLV